MRGVQEVVCVMSTVKKLDEVLAQLNDLRAAMVKEDRHLLAWEKLYLIVDELKSLQAHPKGREIAIAITHIETAILWLKK